MDQQQLNPTTTGSSSSNINNDGNPTDKFLGSAEGADSSNERDSSSRTTSSSKSSASRKRSSTPGNTGGAISSSALRSLDAMKLRLAFDLAWTPAAPVPSSKKQSRASNTLNRSSGGGGGGKKSSDDNEWELFLLRLQDMKDQRHQLNATTEGSTTSTTATMPPQKGLPQLLRPGELLELFAPIPAVAWRGSRAVRSEQLG